METMPVVVGYDGSETGRTALDVGVREAARRKVSLTILHAYVLPVTPVPVGIEYSGETEHRVREAAEKQLADAVDWATMAAPGIEVTGELETLPAAEALIERGRTASLLVLGSRGLGGLGELVLGSTAIQVATHATCPTVVVPPEERVVDAGPEAGRVVVGVDPSPSSDSAIAFAFEEAALRGIGLTAVHAWDAPFFDSPGGKGGVIPRHILHEDFAAVISQEGEILDASMTGWQDKYPEVDVRRVLVHQQAAAALIGASAGAELLVVGSRGRGGFTSLLLGSVSYKTLHRAHCPVAVVRSVRT